MHTKRQIAESVSKYIKCDLMSGMEDRQLKFTLGLAANALESNPCLVDIFFRNPIVSAVSGKSDDGYDIDSLLLMMRNVLDDSGCYPVVVPKIPLLADSDKTIRITSADIDRIMYYLSPQEEKEESDDTI